MSTPSLLKMTAPLRNEFPIPFHDIGPQGRQPRLALVGGLHGNELNGVFVLSRLAAFLNGIATGERPEQRLVERVTIIPAANVPGLNTRSRAWPCNNKELNRMSSDAETGETTERIARTILDITRQAYYRIDIHNSSLDIEEMPQVRLYSPNDDERATACLFGLPAVIERPINKLFTTTLVHAWRDYGGENFVLQAGQAGNLQTSHCEALFRALIAFLDRTGIVEGLTLSNDEEDLHYFSVNQTFVMLSSLSGIFIPRLEVGRWIQAGDCIGDIYDGFTGDIRTEVLGPVSGLVSSLRRQPLLFEGDLIARIQTLGTP
jgi:predicted deacylase